MAQASYSYLDVAALDGVRERFAAGDALAILSADLEEVIWANGPGAALLGHADVETIFGAEAPLGIVAKRQIAAIGGFPAIGRDRALLVRIAKGVSYSAALPFFASAVTLPDGEKAILLAQPAKGEDVADRALSGFAEPGHFVAFVNRTGAVEAASAGFDRLGLAQEALADLAGEATDQRRIVKRLVTGRLGPLPAGLVRLTDERHLLVAIDERYAEAEEDTPDAAETEPEPVREIWYLGSDRAEAAEPPADEDRPVAVAAPERAPADVEAAEASAAAGPDDALSSGETAAIAPPVSSEIVQPAAEEAVDAPPAEEPRAEPVSGPEPAAPTAVEDAPVQRAASPVRFVWRTDAEGKFSQISPDFAWAVGEEAADILGRRFQDVANAFGLDPNGEVAGLLARRDTWSGRSVSWPVAGTDLKIPVDLAALPVYDRNRNFEGFRGFGVARPGDAAVDPEGIGLVLVRLPLAADQPETTAQAPDVSPAEPENEPAMAEAPAGDVAADDAEPEKPTDPFRGEKPALSIVPAPDRRQSDKIIRLAEHRPPTPERSPSGDKALSTGERLAFQQIGERLKKESGRSPDAPDGKTGETGARAPETGSGVEDADMISTTSANEQPEVDDAEAIADLRALDGVTEADATEYADATPVEAETAGAAQETDAAEPEEQASQPRRRPRPGLSLLDFAEWGKDDAGDEAADVSQSAALVEMDEAAALDEQAKDALPDEPTSETDGQPEPVETAEEQAAPAGEAGPVEAVAETLPAEAGAAGTEAAEQTGAVAEAGETSDTPPETAEEAAAGFSILERLPVPVLVHSGDALHYANDEFFALTGYGSIGELVEAGGIGALFADPYEDEADYEPRAKTDRHMRLKTRDGREFPVEAFLQSVPWKDRKALVLVLSRVREGFGGQSPLTAELEARVAEMRTIIDTATDGVVLISRDGVVRSISRPAEALFGLDSDEVAGKPFPTLFAIESQKAARDYLNGLTDHGVASVLNDGREVIGREAEGRFIPLFMTIGKLPGDSGYCAVVRDITQWKRAEEELTQARATAERSSSHKTEFLARVSHEIRTPLNAIIGFSELMLDEKFGPVANDRYRDYLRDINRSGNHVLDLVNDLLDISKIEAGQQEMSYEAVSLNETLAETVALMQPQANRERVIIRSSFASKLPDVVADLRSVRQIALNILSNAVRYTQAGGQVIVSTAYEAHGEVVMRVRDTGIGMTHAEIEQALKPFKQINSLKRTRGDGTGLGLPLTKAMVEANRAKFSIHSTPGEGTLVEIAFPSTRVLAD